MDKICQECGKMTKLTPINLFEDLSRVKTQHTEARALFLPFRIAGVEITNNGIMDDFKAEFAQLNVIYDKDSRSSQTLFHVLRTALFSLHPNYLTAHDEPNFKHKTGRIRIKFDEPISEFDIQTNRKEPFSGVKCIIVMPGAVFSNQKLFDDALKLVKSKKIQLILFEQSCYAKFLKIGKDVNVIRMGKK